MPDDLSECVVRRGQTQQQPSPVIATGYNDDAENWYLSMTFIRFFLQLRAKIPNRITHLIFHVTLNRLCFVLRHQIHDAGMRVFWWSEKKIERVREREKHK